MRPGSLTAPMLAARALLRSRNPALIAWSNARWGEWLDLRASPVLQQPASRLIAVATLSCLDDLPLHVGLMQLLARTDVDCTVVLTLPSEDMAQIVRTQARREGWELLVHILTQERCDAFLQDLPPGRVVALFPFPALLADASVFVRSTPDCPEWAGEHGALEEERPFPGFGRLLDFVPDDVPAAPALRVSDHSATEASKVQIAGVDAQAATVEIAGFGAADELVITGSDGAGEPRTIARQRGEFVLPDRPLRIRAPISLLRAEPQPIRMEARGQPASAAATDLLFHVPPAQLQPWMLSAFLNRGGAGNSVIRAFAEGTGCRIAYAEDEPDRLSDIPAVWGVLRYSDRILAQAKAQQLYFFYIDHAYFDRGHGKSYRIARNRYEAGPVRSCPKERFDNLGVEIAPWRSGGREIVVCPPTDYFMQAHGCADWLETTLATLGRVTDRPIVIRQKPKPGETAVPLREAIQTAHALVTHSSNVAIEAACLGTPVFVAPASAAAPVGRTDLSEIEHPAFPDRDPWLAHLAFNQFSFEEIGDGRAWRMLMELEGRELA